MRNGPLCQSEWSWSVGNHLQVQCSSIFCKVRAEVSLKHRCCLQILFQKPHVNKTQKESAALGHLRTSNDIQVVSLESFAQGIKTRGARLVGPKNVTVLLGFLGLDSVGLFLLEFSVVYFTSNNHGFDGA